MIGSCGGVGDYQGAKGIGLVTVDVKDHLVDVYTTHVVAGYSLVDEYKAHRVTNMMEIVDFVRAHSSSELSIVTGDMNNPPDECEVRYLLNQLQLRDTVEESRSDLILPTHFFSPVRLDYILYQAPRRPWTLKDSFVCYHKGDLETERSGPPTAAPVFYSDHQGVYAEFTLREEPSDQEFAVTKSEPASSFIPPCESLLASEIKLSEQRQRFHLFTSGVLLCSGAASAAASYYLCQSPMMMGVGAAGAGILALSSMATFYYRSIKKGEQVFVENQLTNLQAQER